MIIYSEDLTDAPFHPIDGRIQGEAICWGFTPTSPDHGRVQIQVPEAGVLTCSGFDVDALWIRLPSAVTVIYTPPSFLVLTCGLPVDSSLTVAELKSICTQLSLSTSGLKAELLARVQEATGD